MHTRAIPAVSLSPSPTSHHSSCLLLYSSRCCLCTPRTFQACSAWWPLHLMFLFIFVPTPTSPQGSLISPVSVSYHLALCFLCHCSLNVSYYSVILLLFAPSVSLLPPPLEETSILDPFISLLLKEYVVVK